VAVVVIDVVSEPAVGSVTPKALKPQLSGGDLRQVALLLLVEPCRRIVPMMYIWAWQAPELQPEALISSRITLAAVRDRPAPPYSSG